MYERNFDFFLINLRSLFVFKNEESAECEVNFSMLDTYERLINSHSIFSNLGFDFSPDLYGLLYNRRLKSEDFPIVSKKL